VTPPRGADEAPRPDGGEPDGPTPGLARRPAGLPVPRERGCLGSVVAAAGVLLGGVYVANPTMGLFELLPDNLPLFGNLDEAAATTLIVLGLQYLFGRRPRD
jgi:hypothetical protein